MLRIALVRPGSTDFDEQGRIKGTLDIPLSENGTSQVSRTAKELLDVPIEVVYTSPGQAARETAETIAEALRVKVRRLDRLHNLDQGLWQGKLISEVRQTQPKVYRKWQEHPDTVCPPEGEMLGTAQQRVATVLAKLLKKHKEGTVALVVPEPLARLVRRYLTDTELGNLWEAERECGRWELFEIQGEPITVN